MEPIDITTKILIEIRDEIRSTRTELGERIDGTNARLDGTNARLDTTNARLDRVERNQVATEIRLATELVALAGAVHDMSDRLQSGALAAKVADHEARIARIEGTQGTR